MRKWIVLLMLVGLGGCTGKLAYNNADLLINWYVGQYVDLRPDQKPLLKDTFNRVRDWHRREELPRYVEQLQELKEQIDSQSLTQTQMAEHRERALAHWQRVRVYAAPEVASLAMTMDIEQMSSLFVHLAYDREEDIEEYTERNEIRTTAQRIIDSMEETLGYVTSEQEAVVAAYAPKIQSGFMLWKDYQTTTQQRIRSILISKDFSPNAENALISVLANPDPLRSSELVALSETNRQLYLQMFSDIFPTLEDRQRANLIEQIDEYITLFTELQRQ